VIVPASDFSIINRERIIDVGMMYRLPIASDARPYVDAGGLISYGTDFLWA